MMNLYIRRYICTGLATAPDLLAHLLANVSEAELDTLPPGAEDRFTLREMTAHLADWEPIWRERIRRMATEENPNLPSFDEGQWAMDRDYTHSDFAEQLRRYHDGRRELVALLGTLPPEAWNRIGTRDEVGEVTILSLVAMIQGHDSYHHRQALEYRRIGETAVGGGNDGRGNAL